ncbi:MAG: lipid-A-disaccharide synthase [Deltaproteobacteria bacterium]|nr:MAG: lipid-A-disaccharide synthase [Deltaproteobacteria bacterium]
MGKRIMIVTGEASGDLHAANLVRAMRQIDPNLTFFGMGGPRLESVGVEILVPAETLSVVGIVEIVAQGKDIWRAQQRLRKALREKRPDLLVIIDLPDFNLLLAKYARKQGVRVFYYICPQVWAWRSGRVKTIAARVDRLGVILPFEEAFFRERGLAATYVGHPLLDSVRTTQTREQFLTSQAIAADRKIIGLLPGSRSKEVLSLLPRFIEAARWVQTRLNQKVSFLLPQSPLLELDIYKRAGLYSTDDLDIRLINEHRYNLMAACDCVVAASGTVTLELALLKIPMVVAYRLAPLSHLLAKLLVKLEFFSLVNLIADEKVVPELLQAEVCAENIGHEILELVTNDRRRKEMLEALQGVCDKLGRPGASKRAASVALELLTQDTS